MLKNHPIELQRIGFIGIGLIGHGIARNILEKGYSLTVMGHRNRRPVIDLLQRGADEVNSPFKLARVSDIVFLCVTSSAEVEDIVRREDGILSSKKNGLIVIDCSTSDPTSTVVLADELERNGMILIDAPVGRTPRAAEEGRLNAYVGGNKDVVRYIRPLLETWTENIFHIGPVGSGHQMKLITQLVSMTYAALYAEAYNACRKTGVSTKLFYDIISSGGLNTGFFQNFSKGILERNPDAHKFTIGNCAKDIRYYNKMSDAEGLISHVGNGTERNFSLALENGFEDEYVPRLTDALGQAIGISHEK